jgi:hypothetical protein
MVGHLRGSGGASGILHQPPVSPGPRPNPTCTSPSLTASGSSALDHPADHHTVPAPMHAPSSATVFPVAAGRGLRRRGQVSWMTVATPSGVSRSRLVLVPTAIHGRRRVAAPGADREPSRPGNLGRAACRALGASYRRASTTAWLALLLTLAIRASCALLRRSPPSAGIWLPTWLASGFGQSWPGHSRS